MQQSCTYHWVLAGLLLGGQVLHAQQVHPETGKKDTVCTLHTVTIEAQQSAAKPGQTVHQLDIRAMNAARGRSLAEAISGVSGVNMVRTGNNIAQPMIRGMYGNRILLINNGVRHESQQWSADHAPALDVFGAGSITVVKGAEAVRYGSEAIGGVIVVEPEAMSFRRLAGDVWLAGFSNGRRGTGSARLQGRIPLGKDNLLWRAQATFGKGGDISTPGYRLLNTGSNGQTYATQLQYNQHTTGTWTLAASRYQAALGIFRGSHLGNLTDLQQTLSLSQPLPQYTPDTFSYALGRPRQEVTHTQVKAAWRSPYLTKLGTLSASWAWQQNSREEFDANRPRGVTDPTEADLTFRLGTHTADIALKHKPLGLWTGESGLTGMTQEHVQGGRQRLLPSFVQQQMGAFTRWTRHSETVQWEAGMRAETRHLRAWLHETSGTRVFDHQYNSLTAVAGAHIELSHNTHINASLSSGWRAPNVSELFSRGVHHGQSRYERGDSSLHTERAYSLSATVAHVRRAWKFNAEPYLTLTSGYIYAQPMGQPMLTIRGAFPAFAYTQTDALIAGFDAKVTYREVADEGWQAGATLSLLRATDLSQRTPLPFMPANRATVWGQFSQQTSSRIHTWATGGNLLAVAHQGRIPATTTENPGDFAPPPSGYLVVNAWAEASVVLRRSAADLSPKEMLHLRLSADNLLNARYRDYLNAFRYFSDEPGRSINLQLHVSF